MGSLLVTLRHNIVVDADVDLARAEIAAITGLAEGRIATLKGPDGLRRWLVEHCGKSDGNEHRFLWRLPQRKGVCAFAFANAKPDYFERVVERSSFSQQVLLTDQSKEPPFGPVTTRLSRTRRGGGSYVSWAIPVSTMLEYSAPLLRKRGTVGNIAIALDALTLFLLEGYPANSDLQPHLEDAIRAQKTTLYLSHELHLYKGKFFPRLVHSLINRYAPGPNSLICDPFSGSGTALLEAALLGHRAVGLDVDPTAVLISENKTSLVCANSEELADICTAIAASRDTGQGSLFESGDRYDRTAWERKRVRVPEPMRSRLAKRGREEGYDLLDEIEKETAVALLLISQTPKHLRSLFRVCLSHALTKKIRLRFVGIGNGRFTFDVAKVSVLDLFVKKTQHMLAISEGFDWLKRVRVALGSVEVHRASALDLDSVVRPNSIDFLVTSPPYIPASSGREHYARARAIPLVMTGAASLKELGDLDRAFIGEMSGSAPSHAMNGMPPAVHRTLDFLRSDEQRKPKYLPTLQYYRDIRQVLKNIQKALSPGGAAAVVVAKSHTFYIHKTKQILHTVDAVSAVAELGEQAGLQVAAVHDVPLQKSGGLNARPRSTDEYSEAVIVFKAGTGIGPRKAGQGRSKK